MEMILLENDFNEVLNDLLGEFVFSIIQKNKDKYKEKTKQEVLSELVHDDDLISKVRELEQVIERNISTEEISVLKHLLHTGVLKRLPLHKKIVAVNLNDLTEWEVDNLGNCLKVYIRCDDYIAVKCERGTVHLGIDEDNTDGEKVIYLFNGEIDTDKVDYSIDIEELGVEIASIDICTSEGTITLTNDKKLHIEILRDPDLIDTEDYYMVDKGIMTDFK